MFSVCKISCNMLVCRDVSRSNAPVVFVIQPTKGGFLSLKLILFCALESCLHWLIMEITIKIFLCFVKTPVFLTTLKC